MCDYIIESLDSFILSTCFLTKTIEQIKPVKVYNNFKGDRLQLIKDQQSWCLLFSQFNKWPYLYWKFY